MTTTSPYTVTGLISAISSFLCPLLKPLVPPMLKTPHISPRNLSLIFSTTPVQWNWGHFVISLLNCYCYETYCCAYQLVIVICYLFYQKRNKNSFKWRSLTFCKLPEGKSARHYLNHQQQPSMVRKVTKTLCNDQEISNWWPALLFSNQEITHSPGCFVINNQEIARH